MAIFDPARLSGGVCVSLGVTQRDGSLHQAAVLVKYGVMIEDAVRAVEQVATISREQCRAEFEARFTARRMAEDHVLAPPLIEAEELFHEHAR